MKPYTRHIMTAVKTPDHSTQTYGITSKKLREVIDLMKDEAYPEEQDYITLFAPWGFPHRSVRTFRQRLKRHINLLRKKNNK